MATKSNAYTHIRCQFGFGSFFAIVLGTAAGVAYVLDNGMSRPLLASCILGSGGMIGASYRYRSVRGLSTVRGQAFTGLIGGAVTGSIFSFFANGWEIPAHVSSLFYLTSIARMFYWGGMGALVGCIVGCIAAYRNQTRKQAAIPSDVPSNVEIKPIVKSQPSIRVGLNVVLIIAASFYVHLACLGILGEGTALRSSRQSVSLSTISIRCMPTDALDAGETALLAATPSIPFSHRDIAPVSFPVTFDESSVDAISKQKIGTPLFSYSFHGHVNGIQGTLPFKVGEAVSGRFIYYPFSKGYINPKAKSGMVFNDPMIRFEFLINDQAFAGRDGRIETWISGNMESLLIVSSDLQLPNGWKIRPTTKNPNHFAIWFQNYPSRHVLADSKLPLRIGFDNFVSTRELRIDFSDGVDFPQGTSPERTVLWAQIEELTEPVSLGE